MNKLKQKLTLSFGVIIILALIGLCVFSVKRYFTTEQGLTRKYESELKDTINISEAKKIIKIIKFDADNDDVEDYFVLIGEPKYEESDTSKVKIFKSINSNLEMYNNISIEYVNGSTKKENTYDTKKTYSPDVDITYAIHNDKAYIQVSDSTGNIALLYLDNESLNNIITNSVGDSDFVGYTIEGSFNEEDGNKLEISLDSYGKDYIEQQKEKYTLDYTDTDVNSTNYRLTYMANKFSNFELVESEDKAKLYLLCTQYILYSNQEDMTKNEGFVIVKFRIRSNNKLAYDSVSVQK